MNWITPDFQEISVNCEINSYAAAENMGRPGGPAHLVFAYGDFGRLADHWLRMAATTPIRPEGLT